LGKQYGILSDIHGNLEALRTALAFLEGLEINEIYCLGDIVGYGEGAAACVELIQKHSVNCIQGNHDGQVRPPRDPRMRVEACLALEIANRQLSDKQVHWLSRLPHPTILNNRMVLVHGALTGRDDYILTQEAVDQNFEIMATRFPDISLCFFGHTHLPMVIGQSELHTRILETTTFKLERGQPYLINPGSVGQPRDGSPLLSFALFDPEEHEVCIVRLDYNIEAEQERMRKAGIPDKLVDRLAVGK